MFPFTCTRRREAAPSWAGSRFPQVICWKLLWTLWADAAADSARRARCEEFRKADAAGGRSRASSASDSLFAFDPNTVREDELIRLGFTSRQAAGILHYREAGAVFRRAEDFSRCYTVSDEMYRRLEPYIEIGAPYPR